jgi:hypothetical protein
MKKIFTILLTLFMVIMLGACSSKTVSPDNKDKPVTVDEPEIVDEPETVEIPEIVLEPEIEDEPGTVESNGGESTTEPKESNPTEDDNKEVVGIKPDFGVMSDDIYSFQIEINGELYQFPMKYTEFTSYGWKYKEDNSEKLDANYMLLGTFENNGLVCYADIVNFDINALQINECYVSSISLDSYLISKVENVSLRLPKGIEYGKATIEDVKEAYGTPSDIYEGSSYTKLTYKYDRYQVVEIEISNETGVIESIEIENAVIPENFVVSAVNTEVPEIVKSYKAPDKLGDDFDNFTVQFDGHMYQLPAPVSSFVANGWKIDESNTEMVIPGRGYGYVFFVKDDRKMKVMANNYSEGATSIENCFVTQVKSGDSDNKTEIIISRNITIGMSESELDKALKDVKHEKDTSLTSFIYYNIEPGESLSDEYEIYVNESGVYKIVVKNSPRYNDFVK